MKTPLHILAQEGILTTFSISKRVTAKDIKKMREKFKEANINNSQLQELIKQSVLEETKKAINDNKIPGLILPIEIYNQEENKKIIELTYFSSLISKKISEKKMDKYYSCYIINAIINMLGLSEHDFEEFHKKFSKYKEGNGTDSPTES